MKENDDLLTESGAAKYLSMAPGTLRNWRSLGRGPVYIKVSSSVRYAPDDLRRYVANRTRRP